MVLAIKPTLQVEKLRAAPTLLDAGLDSMDFVRLPLDFQEKLGMTQTQERVAQMANLSFDALSDRFQSGEKIDEAVASMRPRRSARANRAIARNRRHK